MCGGSYPRSDSLDGKFLSVEVALPAASVYKAWFSVLTMFSILEAEPTLGVMAIVGTSNSQGPQAHPPELVRDAAFVSPGIKWKPDENGVIAFDCRNRGW